MPSTALQPCPIPGAVGTLQPEGLGTNGVLLLGEALGQHEAMDGLPFRPGAPAGSVLERAIRRAGFRREQFVLWNVVPTRPPNDWLEGAPYEAEAIAWGLPFVDEVVARFRPRVICALGNVALRALCGLSGIMETRGYPIASRYPGIPALGALHPSFLRRGAMSYLGVLMHDLKFAVALATVSNPDIIRPRYVEFWSPVLWRNVRYEIPTPLPPLNQPIVPPGYVLYPTEVEAWDFYRECLRDASRIVAYDIETPRSRRTKEDESDELDAGEAILSIQFSLAPGSGIFMPWRDPFTAVARAILALPNPKAGANVWRFDDPRLALAKAPVAGTRHDIRWAWKHFQPDLSGGLQFITSMYAPELGPWKHLHESHPEVYGIRDCDAVLRCL